MESEEQVEDDDGPDDEGGENGILAFLRGLCEGLRLPVRIERPPSIFR